MKIGPRSTRKLLKHIDLYLKLFDVPLNVNRDADMSGLHGIMNQFFHNHEEYEIAKAKWFGLIEQLENEIKMCKIERTHDYYYNYVAQSLAARMAPYATSMYFLRETMKKWKYTHHNPVDSAVTAIKVINQPSVVH